MAPRPDTPHPLRQLRLLKGFTQAELAKRADISRTAVSAIEQKTLVPSVTAALALAQALGTSVETLFGQPSNPAAAVPQWAWVPHTPARYWQAEVQGTLRCYPGADLVQPPWRAADGSGSGERLPSHVVPEASRTLVIATCDPAAPLLAEHYERRSGCRMLIVRASSQEAVRLLSAGLVHVAGLHLTTAHEDYNANLVRSHAAADCSLLRVAEWEAGIGVAPAMSGKSLKTIVRRPVRWVAREEGSGAWACLREVLPQRTNFEQSARNHHEVLLALQAGYADAGPLLRSMAEPAGLPFLSVRNEIYELAVPSALLGDLRWQTLQHVVRAREFQQELAKLPGCTILKLSGELRRIKAS